MRTTGTSLLAVALAITAGLSSPTYAGMLIGSSGGVLYDVDRVTGLASNPRETGLTGVAITYGNGTLYGSPGRSLYTIDAVTGEAQALGELDGLEVPQTVYDMAWDHVDDTLFALVHLGGTTLDQLYTVDTTTLRVTEIGTLDDSTSTIAFNHSGALFAVDPVDDVLATIDKTNGQMTSAISLIPPVVSAAITCDQTGLLYLATRVEDDPSILHLLDPDSGVLTPIGSTGLNRGLASLAYIPEPGTLVLLLMGCLAVGRRTRRLPVLSAETSVRNSGRLDKGYAAMTGSRFFVAGVLGVFSFASVAAAQGPGLGPDPTYSHVVNGDFVVTGTSISSARDSVREPDETFTLIIDIPSTASLVKAYVNWSYLTETPHDPDLRTIIIEEQEVPVDTVVVYQSISDDICQLAGADARTAVYLADVTDIVSGGMVDGHGEYDVAGAVEQDDDSYDSSGPLGEGISLLVVYSESTEPLRLINVYSGLIQTDKDLWEAEATLGFVDQDARPVRYMGGPVHFFVNALDGQNGDDVFYINDQNPHLFLDTGCVVGQGAWCGELGPGPDGKNWYDHAECPSNDHPQCSEASMYMDVNDEQIVITQIKPPAVPYMPEPDCIGHSFAAVAFEYVPCPVIHVDADAPGGTGPGTSWDNAYHRLQDAIANIDPLCAGPCATIRVAEGVYRPDQDENNILGSNDPAATF